MSLLKTEEQARLSAVAAAADRALTEAARLATETARDITLLAQAETESARDEALNYGDARIERSWAALAAVTGMAAGDTAQVVSTDTGTHTDPVVGGTVKNAGVFKYSASPAGWERIADLQGQIASDHADRAEAAAEQALEFGLRPTIFEPRIVPGVNDDGAAGVVVSRTPSGRVLQRAAPVSLIGRVATNEGGLAALGELVGPAPLRVSIFEPRVVPGKASADQPLVRTPLGKVLIWDRPEQVTDAVAAVSARVDRTLDTNGMPRKPIYGEWYLRRSRAKLQALAAGLAGTQFNVYLPGDSWIDNVAYNGRVFASRLRAAYGNGAIGWISFSGSPLDANLWNSNAGTWATVDETAASPDIYAVQSSTVGSQRTINAGSQAAVPTAAKLQWKGTADGVIRYRTGTGAWTTLNVQGSGIQHADLINLPTAAPWTMTFEVVSGSVDLRGVLFSGAANGVVIHKGGNSGSHTNDWAGVNRAEFIAAVMPLPMDLVIIPFGVNDQGAGISPEAFVANIVEIIDRIRTARPTTGGQPGPDFLVSIPPELKNRLAVGLSMMPYLTAVLDAADQYRFAVVGLPYVFGTVPADYDAWMDADFIHPAPAASDPLTLASNLITRTWCEAIGAYKAL